MQLLAKFKQILDTGFRATLNLLCFEMSLTSIFASFEMVKNNEVF